MNRVHSTLPQTSQFHTVIHITNFTHLCDLLGLCLHSLFHLVPYYSSKMKDRKPNPKEEYFSLSPRAELLSHTSLPMEAPLWSSKNRNGRKKEFLEALHGKKVIIYLRSICSTVNDHTSNFKPIILKIETNNH